MNLADIVQEPKLRVGITSRGAVSLQIEDLGEVRLAPIDALWLSRQLMRMAFILEPSDEPQAGDK